MKSSKKLEISYSNENLDLLPIEKQEIISILRQSIKRDKDIEKLLPLLMNIKFFKDEQMTQEDLGYVWK